MPRRRVRHEGGAGGNGFGDRAHQNGEEKENRRMSSSSQVPAAQDQLEEAKQRAAHAEQELGAMRRKIERL